MSIPGQIADSVRRQASDMLRTGSRFKRFDKVRQRHFWSTYRFVPDDNGYVQSGEYEFFQITQGQMGQGFNWEVTLRETNWLGESRVPDNENLIVTEFGLTPMLAFPDDEEEPSFNAPELEYPSNWAYPANCQQFLENTVLNLKYLTNEVSLGLCSDFAQASGPTWGWYAPSIPQEYPVASPGPNQLDVVRRQLFTNGFPAPDLRRKLAIPIFLQHGETFRMMLSIPSGRGFYLYPPQYNAGGPPVDYTLDVRLDFWATESFVE